MLLSDYAKSAPHSPGVYKFLSAEGAVLYVGKAKDLRSRLSSYFSGAATDRARQMLSQAKSIEVIVTDNEAEALILENSLIKEHFPKYNIQLKDNEKYTYILVTDEAFPRMLLVRRSRGGRIKMRGSVYGPFVSGSAYVLVSSTLRKLFKIRTCKVGQGKPCLQYHLGFCMGPCAGLVTPEEYGKQVEKLKEVLSGGKKLEQLLEELQSEMLSASKMRQFERAIELRNAIKSLSSLLEKQKMESRSEADEDYVSFAESGGNVLVQIFRQVGGVIKDRKRFSIPSAVSGSPLSEFLARFYEAERIPRKIYVEQPFEDMALVESFLSGKRGGPVSIAVPEKGDKKKLLELLRKNIMLEISKDSNPALIELQNALSLPRLPKTIECFDVSNLQSSNIVGAMSQFVNGFPKKSSYRRFKIRSIEQQNDFAAIWEIVFRRYSRLKAEGSSLPDLVVVDGGPGQLNAAISAISELGLSIPCVSLAKKEEEIYLPGKRVPIKLPKSSEALHVLQFARDEAHRFGVSYHRLLRRKKTSLKL
ncbi:MAG: excinuclease ABC subunit UvrC [Candidatus Micrarchaeota archaeon]|nr:excinuclease ABC subunit UvrC [Candidatus Micrarchaeota archaeon]